jgi:hypothetical protein
MQNAFVIHLHSGHGAAHLDLMLQRGEVLATWRLPSDPAALACEEALEATRLPDHRLAYLTYEGPVSRGRGRVRRIDRGTWEPIRTDEALWEFHLRGASVRGQFELRRDPERTGQWTLTRLSGE